MTKLTTLFRLDFDVVLEWQRWQGKVPGMFKPPMPEMAPPDQQNRGGFRGGRGFRGRGRGRGGGRGRGRGSRGGGWWNRETGDIDAPKESDAPSTKESDATKD